MNNRYLILLFVVAGFTSCKDNDNVFKTVLYANVNVINASANTLNFYLNGTRQNISSSLAPGSSSGYLSVPSGSENYQFKKAVTAATAATSTVLFNLPLSLTDSTNTSVYITGETTDMAFYTTDVLEVDTTANKFTARFVNASPDAGNLTCFVGDTVNFANRAFKSTSSFLPVTNGAQDVKIYFEGNTTAQIDTSITFLANHIYTLYTKGLVKGTGNTKFSLGVVVNY